jgi:hypothetical protein
MGNMPDGELNAERRKELIKYWFPQPSPSFADRLRGRKSAAAPPCLRNHKEALDWARSHKVRVPTGRSWRPRVDLRLAPESLSVLCELLRSAETSLRLTAWLALQYNGALINSDAGKSTHPAYNLVTFPDGTERKVKLHEL